MSELNTSTRVELNELTTPLPNEHPKLRGSLNSTWVKLKLNHNKDALVLKPIENMKWYDCFNIGWVKLDKIVVQKHDKWIHKQYTTKSIQLKSS